MHSSATAGASKKKTKLEVLGSVKTWLKVKNSYKIRREVHSSATAVQGSDKVVSNTAKDMHEITQG